MLLAQGPVLVKPLEQTRPLVLRPLRCRHRIQRVDSLLVVVVDCFAAEEAFFIAAAAERYAFAACVLQRRRRRRERECK